VIDVYGFSTPNSVKVPVIVDHDADGGHALARRLGRL